MAVRHVDDLHSDLSVDLIKKQLPVDFTINHLVYKILTTFLKHFHHIFPVIKLDVLKLLVLSNKQFKTHRLLIYHHK